MKRKKKDADDVQEDKISARRLTKKTCARLNEVVHSDNEVVAALISQGKLKHEV